MANEITVTSSFVIKKGSLDERRTTTFREDVTTSAPKGPVPGAVQVTTAGVDVNLAELARPGLCRITNLGRTDGVTDATAYFEWGIREPATGIFYPVGEVRPGKSYVFYLSRNLLSEYEPSTGTGTSAFTNFLHLKATSNPQNALVKAFEA